MYKEGHINKFLLVDEVNEHRHNEDVLAFQKNETTTLELKVNHFGGCTIYINGAEHITHIGTEKIVDEYAKLYEEFFTGENDDCCI